MDVFHSISMLIITFFLAQNCEICTNRFKLPLGALGSTFEMALKEPALAVSSSHGSVLAGPPSLLHCAQSTATCCCHYRKSSVLYNFLFSAQDRKFTWCGKWLLLPLQMWECWCRRNSVAPECFLPLTRIHPTSPTLLRICCFPDFNFMPL